jgi:hypothetical protein
MLGPSPGAHLSRIQAMWFGAQLEGPAVLAPRLCVACQRDGTTSLPRARDQLEVSASIVGFVAVNGDGLGGAVGLAVGGAFDDQGVCA